MVKTRGHNPDSVPAPVGGYNLGLEVLGGGRVLYISGQIPERTDGPIPDGFEEQCGIVWQNIEAVLASADMTVGNLVKVTTFLTHEDQVEVNGAVRRRVLDGHRPALTVMIARTLESKWLLEIEAVAMA